MAIRLVVASALLVAGCASQPASRPESVAAVAAATPAATKAPAPAANQVATVQEARKAGYKIVNEDGKTLYCREQLKTGSNLRKETICLTEKELETARAASQRNLEQMQRRIPPPHGT
jgi:hypothetical protein